MRRPDPRLVLVGAPAALLGVAFGLGKIVRDCRTPPAAARSTSPRSTHGSTARACSCWPSALDRLHLGVEESRRLVVRPVLSGLVARSGEGLGAIAVIGLVLGAHASLRHMLWLYLAVLLAWAGAVRSLGHPTARRAPGPAPE